MDYHLTNGLECLEDYQKPVFFWTKADVLAYVEYLDMYIEAVKRDYQTIVDYQSGQNVQIMDDSEKEQIAQAITGWAHDREVILQDSEDIAFPTNSHISLAKLNEDRISKAVGTVHDILSGIGAPSESQDIKEEQSQPGVFGEMSDLVKWGVIGLGLFLAYKVFMEYRR